MTIGGPALERRGRLTAPGWSSWLPMRWRGSPAWWQGCLPSKPPSHASLERLTRGYRAIPGPAVMRWRWGWRTMVTWHRWAGSPKKASLRRPLTTFRWTEPTWNMATAKPWALGERRQAPGQGGGVRRHLAVSDPGPMSVSRRPLAGSTALTDAAVCSFWSGLTLSPWRLSVVRGTQLLQRVGAHVLGWNSGTHGWLRWSVTNKLIPVNLHVPHELLFPALEHVLGRALCSVHCIRPSHSGSHRGQSWGGWLYRGPGWLGDMGQVTRKNSAKAWGVAECKSVSGRAGRTGGDTGVGPPGKDPGKCPVDPGCPVRAAGDVTGWYVRTTDVATPRAKEEPCRTTLAAAS